MDEEVNRRRQIIHKLIMDRRDRIEKGFHHDDMFRIINRDIANDIAFFRVVNILTLAESHYQIFLLKDAFVTKDDVLWFLKTINADDNSDDDLIRICFTNILANIFRYEGVLKLSSFRELFFKHYIKKCILEYEENNIIDKPFVESLFEMPESKNIDYFDFFFGYFIEEGIELDLNSFDDIKEQIEQFEDRTLNIIETEKGEDICGFCKSFFYVFFIMDDVKNDQLRTLRDNAFIQITKTWKDKKNITYDDIAAEDIKFDEMYSGFKELIRANICGNVE